MIGNKKKAGIKKFIHHHIGGKDKVYGTTTIGAKGQVVIPAQARKDLNLKPGDHLFVMGRFGKVVGLMKVDQLEDFIKTILRDLAGTGMEEDVKKYFNSFFKQ